MPSESPKLLKFIRYDVLSLLEKGGIEKVRKYNLQGGDFTSLGDCTSYPPDMSDMDFTGADFMWSLFPKCNCVKSNFSYAFLGDIYAENSDFRDCVFRGAIITDSIFYGCNFQGADFTGAIIDDLSLKTMNLTGAVLKPMTELSEDELYHFNFWAKRRKGPGGSESDITKWHNASILKTEKDGKLIPWKSFNQFKHWQGHHYEYNMKHREELLEMSRMERIRSAIKERSNEPVADQVDPPPKQKLLKFNKDKVFPLIFKDKMDELVKYDLRGADFSYINGGNSNLSNLDLRGGCFQGCILNDVDFNHTNLAFAFFKDCSLSRANFTFANCRGAIFIHCELGDSKFIQSDLTGVLFEDTSLNYSDVSSATFGAMSHLSDKELDEYDKWLEVRTKYFKGFNSMESEHMALKTKN